MTFWLAYVYMNNSYLKLYFFILQDYCLQRANLNHANLRVTTMQT